MEKQKVSKPNPRSSSRPILKADIEEAQRNTTSNRQAAKWMNETYFRYKKYAKIYGIYDRHLNPLGLGTAKGFAKRPNSIPLRDVFANKKKNYSMVRLKNRMLARGLLEKECGLCGFNEVRITDNKMPLMLTFKNTMGDYSRDNLYLLCYNCMFLTTGAPWSAHKNHIKKSLTDADYKPSTKDEIRQTDYIDTDHDTELEQELNTHYSDIESMKDDILRNLGR